MCSELWNDIISTSIGGAFGGAAAGLVILAVQVARNAWRDSKETERVFKWLEENSDEKKQPFRTTRAIASYNNLTDDRVRYLCSKDDRIKRSTGDKDDLWSIHIRSRSGDLFTGTHDE